MINLRYHIVSLTAVFLALAIGVLLGGTYLDKYTVDQLDQSISNAERQIRETRAENDRLRGNVSDAEARNQALIGGGTNSLFADNLTDVPVLIIAAEGADETARRNLVQSLNTSGAEFRGTLTVTGRVSLSDEQARDLARSLDLRTDETDAVVAELVDRFGAALVAAGQPPALDPAPSTTVPTDSIPATTTPEGAAPGSEATTTAPTDGTATTTTTVPVPDPPTEPEVVSALIQAGLLSFEAPVENPATGPLLSGSSYRYVFLAGSSPSIPATSFLIPVLRRMAESGPVPALVASTTPSEDGLDTAVTVVREDPELNRLVSTVDNLDWFNGLVSTVLGLEEIGRGARGHYGEGRGAAAAIPTGT
ncbi:MAG: copper transporter [Acidimicrobiales bacterium]|jgi:hypothetical protein